MNELTRDQLRDERARVTRRVTLIGALINLVLSLVKMVIGYLAQSQALIADGLHSLSDLLSDGLVYFAAQHARQGPDDEHPYGHGRYETAATLGLGLLLVVVAVGILWDAVGRLFEAQPTGHPGWLALYAAIGSVLLKEWLYHYTMRAARRIRSDMMKANAWHHRSDSISTLVVLVGLAGTYAGWFYLDAIAAAVVGLMIARFGYQMAWEAVQELVDAGLDQERLNAVQERIRAVDGVRDLHMRRGGLGRCACDGGAAVERVGGASDQRAGGEPAEKGIRRHRGCHRACGSGGRREPGADHGAGQSPRGPEQAARLLAGAWGGGLSDGAALPERLYRGGSVRAAGGGFSAAAGGTAASGAA